MELPAKVGKYELEEFLGGGMSHVYRARDTVIGRTVAVKILTEAGCQDPEAKARFLAEARMAGNLTHDNVLSIYDFGEDQDHKPFMVMEYLRGEDLRHAIKNQHTGDLKSKLKIAAQVARALAFIHSQKIIHRDIKPENIHINAAGVVKLMDFGIAKTEGLAMTRAGYVLGTPYYMAPEQVMGHDVTEQVDVYSFGILLFELMTTVKPISGDSVERIFYSILNEPLNLEPLRQAGAPEAVCDLVARCTAKGASERPQGFTPVIAELERMIAELEAPTMVLQQPEIVVTPAPQRPAWLVPVILLVVAGLAVGLYLAIGKRPPPPPPPPPQYAQTIQTDTGEMVLVAEGKFLFGEQKETVLLPAFYIDKTEVSNKSYAKFCAEKGHALPEGFPADQDDYPVVNVTMVDAREYASWAGKKLPTGLQWEKAARGSDGRMFPWGNEEDPTRANMNSSRNRKTAPALQPVTAFSQGASPSGALNMFGNVWELVAQDGTATKNAMDLFSTLLTPPPTTGEKWWVIRGGSVAEPLADASIWDVFNIPERWKAKNIGFRCVKDPEPKDQH